MSKAHWLLLLASMAIFSAFLFRPDFDPDLYLHLTLGRDIVDNRISPYIESHTFTFNGKSDLSLPWLFESVSYLFYKNLGGWVGVRALKGLLWILGVVSIVYFCARRNIPHLLTVLYLSVVAFELLFKNSLRAHSLMLACYPLFVGFIYEMRKSWKWKDVFLLSALLIIFNNWHHSSVVLFCLVLAVFAERFAILIYRRSLELKVASAQFATLLLTGFLTPSFYHPLWNYTVIDNYWRVLVLEMASPTFNDFSIISSSMFLIFALCLLFCIYKRRLFELFCFMGFGAQAFQYVRMISMDVILLVPFAVVILNEIYQLSKSWAVRPAFRWAIYCAVGYIPTMALLSLFQVLNISYDNPITPKDLAPAALPREGTSLNLKGRVFNEYAMGGYLIFHFPELKIFLDGRGHTLYPVEHVKRFNDFAFSPNRDWAVSQWKEMDIDYLFGKYSLANNYQRHGLFSGDYGVQWMSNHFLLLARSGPKFSSLSKTIHKPQCFDKVSAPEIEKDLSEATKHFGTESDIYRSLSVMKDLQTRKGVERLNEYAKENSHLFEKSDFLIRLLSSAYANQGFQKDAVGVLLQLKESLPVDIINFLKLAVGLKDDSLAALVIENAPAGEWFYPDELAFVVETYQSIREKPPHLSQKIDGYLRWKPQRLPSNSMSSFSKCDS